MQVSQVAEQNNYAVVGGGNARAFQIGSSAQAFKILSDTLYSDKHRAVVREVLCNAVDAHIVSGVPEKPVNITLSDGALIIQDFGPGIADECMIEIYATYFGSTKQDDDKQTGGFGLGSKSPFAYTEHFTVTSCHKGFRRVYALTLGDEDTDGAPAVKLMATAPCGDETGVTVAIPIESDDKRQFRTNILDVVKEGGMTAHLNGNPVPTRDYTELRAKGIGVSAQGMNQIVVLYGNVLYKLDRNAGIAELYDQLTQWSNFRRDIILYAPPSSVTVTPSRESLGYNPRTIATLRDIMKRQLHILRSNKGKSLRAAAIEFIKEKAAVRENVAALYAQGDRAVYGGLMKENDLIFGAVEIAQLHGREAVFTRSFNIEKFLNIASRYFGDHPKLMMGPVEPTRGWMSHTKRVASNIQWVTRRETGLSFFQEQHQIITRKLLRVVPPDLWKHLYYMHNDGAGVSSLIKSRTRRGYRADKPSINPMCLTIGDRRDTVIAHTNRGFFLISKDITPEHIAEIQAKAPMFRIKINTPEKVAPVKKPRLPKIEKAPDQFHVLAMDGKFHRGRNYNGVRGLSKETNSNPKAYIAWAPSHVREIGPAIPETTLVSSVFADINDAIKGTVLGVGVREVAALKKANVPSVESIILDRLENQVRKGVSYAGIASTYITPKAQSRHYYHQSSIRLFGGLIAVSSRFAHAAIGVRFNGPNSDKLQERLWRLAKNLFSDEMKRVRMALPASFDEKAFEEYRKRYAAIVEQVTKEIDPKIVRIMARYNDGDLKESDIPHLSFFGGVVSTSLHANGATKEQLLRLVEMIEAEGEKFMQPDPSTLDENGDQL